MVLARHAWGFAGSFVLSTDTTDHQRSPDSQVPRKCIQQTQNSSASSKIAQNFRPLFLLLLFCSLSPNEIKIGSLTLSFSSFFPSPRSACSHSLTAGLCCKNYSTSIEPKEILSGARRPQNPGRFSHRWPSVPDRRQSESASPPSELSFQACSGGARCRPVGLKRIFPPAPQNSFLHARHHRITATNGQTDRRRRPHSHDCCSSHALLF